MDAESKSLDALSNILDSLSQNPFDISLHVQHINLAQTLESSDPTHLHAAREMLVAQFPATDDVWMLLIKSKEESVDLNDAEGILDLMELYSKAEADYLSLPILIKHVQFLIDRHAWLAAVDEKPEEFGELFSTEWTRASMAFTVAKGANHLTQSHTLWELRRDWEMQLLEASSDAEKPSMVEIVNDLLLERLQQPHANHEETYQLYSTFTTTHQPPHLYEDMLVAASKLRAPVVKAFAKREASETGLVNSKFSLDAYNYYITWEKRAKNVDVDVLSCLYERAIAEAARRRFIGEVSAESMLGVFWGGYCDALRIHGIHEKVESDTLKRAVRSAPGSGDIWARYLRFLERTSASEVEIEERETVAAAYTRAMSTNLLQKDVEQLVPAVLARAGYEKRRLESETVPVGIGLVLLLRFFGGLFQGGFAFGGGVFVPHLAFSVAFLNHYFNLEMSEKAISLWQGTAKHMKKSYLAWTAYTDACVRAEKQKTARAIFSDIAMKQLDWPEAVWDAWIAFEHQHGTVEQLEACLDKVEKAQYSVNMHRAKEAEHAQYQTMQVAAENQASNLPVAEVPIPTAAPSSAMEVDTEKPAQSETRGKRKADDELTLSADNSKKPRVEQKPPPLKRDRENSTVFVADLPSGTTEDELKVLFKDCGKVREVKFTQLQGSLVATVEFFERESIPAALTKDKKRLRDEEIAVHLAWKSTLYVTNFPESADDTVVRELFGAYGLIFDVRWPSKKFNNTRRFCYVQYTAPASAEKALELHQRELEPNRPISVLISNPERKKERTDADANEKEIYVAGLSKFTTKEDLSKLFKTYGPVKDVRMAAEENGQSKGFAFVEFEDQKDAQAAVAANNYELKKRRIAVTLADSRVRARNRNMENQSGLGRQAETRSRSVRVRGLPPATQEGLLQQTLEKHALIKRVEVFLDLNEAVVELENAAEAGKLLLRTEPLVFNGNTLRLSEETSSGTGRSRPAAPLPKTGGMFVPRAAKSRPRAGLGAARKSIPAAQTTPAPSISAPSTSATSIPQQGRGQDDFRKMLSGQ
ncbi:hypothetical protein FIBSPDRAFT_776202 [Athelia psychrophila]|uniref:U4/U6 snRNA-associated-splicing factor PRP24 n=1 Tax=Athelia psychrophila TaxID=1759441 RepID=A0A166UBK5_9AGAM|nr:hypothetical protein FIBSPDRAFT_776202 [Fibularhizoctonia sp. CBS 109695]